MNNIIKGTIRHHLKASEKYIDVTFKYDSFNYNTSIPLEYRRTGTSIEDKDIDAYLEQVYQELNPKNRDQWKKEQISFWATKPNASITKSFFDKLIETFDWTCVNCSLPQNPNWARRTQDLKDFGYTISTKWTDLCPKCGNRCTQLIIIPIKRGGINGYETWSKELRQRIIKVLKSYDSYEAKYIPKESLLPDHKFPEIRWDEYTKRQSLENLSDQEIIRDFQLLSNQRNQQKREVCRNCFQSNKRGIIYGIKYFYSGNEDWNPSFPKIGKESEKGCFGCGWYDIQAWRNSLTKVLSANY